MPETDIMILYGITLSDNYLELLNKPCTIVTKIVSMKEIASNYHLYKQVIIL